MKSAFKIMQTHEKLADGTIETSFQVETPIGHEREKYPNYFDTLAEAEEWVRIQLIQVPPTKLIKTIPVKMTKAQREKLEYLKIHEEAEDAYQKAKPELKRSFNQLCIGIGVIILGVILYFIFF